MSENQKDILDTITTFNLRARYDDYKNRLKRYDMELMEFEGRYGMSSDLFYEKFEAGKIGDEMDYFEWSGLIELRRDLLNKMIRTDSKTMLRRIYL